MLQNVEPRGQRRGPDEPTNQKLEQSILNFRTIHPDWMPGEIVDEDNSAYVNQVNDPLRSVNAYRMGATHSRRHSQPFLGFAASSQNGQLPSALRRTVAGRQGEQSIDVTPSKHVFSGMHLNTRTARPQVDESELLTEMEPRSPEQRSPEQRFESELGDSFMTPSQTAEETEHEQGGNQGVLGLLNQLYQESGTGKGIGI